MIKDNKFQLVSNHLPAGDQPQAIEKLVEGLNNNAQNQTLLGVTGSGKTLPLQMLLNVSKSRLL